MDVEAIARRIAQDHGVTVLEKDVIETLEKLKAASKEKITGAGEAQKPAQTPEVSPITSVGTSTAPVNSTPAPLPTGTGTSPAPLPAVPAQLPTVTGAPSAPVKPSSEPVTDTTKPVTEHVNAAQNEASKLVIPTNVKPLPIDLIDDLIRQNFNRDGIEKILKASGHTSHRRLIAERMKVIKPTIKVASTVAGNGTKPASTETTRVITSSEHVINGTEPVITPPTDGANTPSVKTPENTGNSGISGTDAVARLLAALQTGSGTLPAGLPAGSAPQQTVPATLPAGSSSLPAPLPTDVASLVAALQQFLASYKQPSGTVPAASEQPNESDSN